MFVKYAKCSILSWLKVDVVQKVDVVRIEVRGKSTISGSVQEQISTCSLMVVHVVQADLPMAEKCCFAEPL